ENVVNYTVVVGVDNRAGKLLPGMTATVDFQVQTAEGVLLVPNAALRFRPSAEMLNAAGTGTSAPAESGARRPRDSAAAPAAGAGERPRGNFATLWYIDDASALATTRVRTGISDGILTEIEGPDVREGMQVIAGVLTQGENGTANPFRQDRPDRRTRGGF
ncbi:MAG TPA: hypothetical protein VK922_06530, partial [Gemmatimonadaceae bacterium]|nr:hypothetical protein [Gemmatimonadaceae bacterium]